MALNPVASERHDMEVERIETVACKAYTSASSTEFGGQVAPHKVLYLIIEMYSCTSVHKIDV